MENDPVHRVEQEDILLESPPVPAVPTSLRGTPLPKAEYHDGFMAFEDQEYFYRHLQLEEPRGVVFLIHGFCISSFELGHCAQQFRRMGLESFCMDLTGHGRTASGSKLGLIRNWSEVKESLIHFVRLMLHRDHVQRLVDLPVFLYGISMGGALAFQLAHAMPDIFEQGGAILVSPCFRIPGLPAPWIQKMLKGVSKLVPLMPIAKHRHDILTSDEAKAEWIQTKGRFYKIDGHVKARTAAQLVELARDCCSKFCEFRVPFITIHGTDDKITCHRASRELYYCSPQRFKRIKEFDGAMHVLQLESDEVVDRYWTEITMFVRDRLMLIEAEKATMDLDMEEEAEAGRYVAGLPSRPASQTSSPSTLPPKPQFPVEDMMDVSVDMVAALIKEEKPMLLVEESSPSSARGSKPTELTDVFSCPTIDTAAGAHTAMDLMDL